MALHDFAGAAGAIGAPFTQIGTDDLERNGSGAAVAGSSSNVCGIIIDAESTTQEIEFTLGSVAGGAGAFIGGLVLWDSASGDGYQVDCTLGSPTINVNVWDNNGFVESRGSVNTQGNVNFAAGDKIRVEASVLGNGNPQFIIYHTPAAGGGEDTLTTIEDTDAGITPTGTWVGVMIYTDNAVGGSSIDSFDDGIAGVTHYTITADAGSYTYTGTAATLKRGLKVAAATALFAITGTDATLTYGSASGVILDAEPGSVAVTGTAASLEIGRKVTASAGSFAITGGSTTFVLTIAANAGAFVITGTDATLDYSGAGSQTMTADAGSYSVTGTAATLKRGLKIAALTDNFAIAGPPTTLTYSGASALSLRTIRSRRRAAG